MAAVSIILLSFASGTFCTNLLLTIMIAGRVFFIGHQVAKLIKQPMGAMYKTIIHASVESGLLYPFVMAGYVICLILLAQAQSAESLVANNHRIIGPEVKIQVVCNIIYSCLNPVMGIASTLIIVRSALGIAIKDKNSFKMTVLGEQIRNRISGGMVDSVFSTARRSNPTLNELEQNMEGVEGNRKQGSMND
ncbi:hypothetical protein PQX77_021539 [Marasmius sp. AFHP31]|nr:hypothetical protein PQX77_021539 [Marasmius sp. AFHP31]